MLSKLKHWFSPKESLPVTPLDTGVRLLETINPSVFNYTHSSDMSVFQVNVMFSTLETYTLKLKSLTNSLKNKQTVYAFESNSEIKTVLISDFFLDDKRNYIDEPKAVLSFIRAAGDFLLAYKEIQNEVTDEVYVFHNRMILQGLVQNTLLVILTLSEISLQYKQK